MAFSNTQIPHNSYNSNAWILSAFFPFLIISMILINQNLTIAIAALLVLIPFLKKVMKFEVLLFLLVLSLILEKYSYYIGFTIRLPLIAIACIIVFFVFRSLLIGQFRIEAKLLPLLILLYLNYWLGVIWTFNPIKTIRLCILYFFLFALFTIVINIFQTNQRIRSVIKSLIAVGLIGASYGLYQVLAFALGLPLELPFTEYLQYTEKYNTSVTVFSSSGMPIPRINSTFNDPVLIGAFSGMVLMIMLGLYVYHMVGGTLTKQRKAYYWCGFVVLALCIILSFSRSCWIGVLAGFLCLGILLLRDRKMHRLVWKFTGAGLFIFSLVLLFSPFLKEIIIGRITQTFDLSDTSTSEHLKWAYISLHAWSENPIFGVGLNNFGEFYAKKYQAHSQVMTHSAYLSFIAETGTVGFLLEISLIAVILRMAFHALRVANQDGNMYYKYLLMGLISGYFVVLGSNITYHFYPQFYVWFLKGLIVATSSYVLHLSGIKRVERVGSTS